MHRISWETFDFMKITRLVQNGTMVYAINTRYISICKLNGCAVVIVTIASSQLKII